MTHPILPVLVIHGGAGVMDRSRMPADQAKATHAGLAAALTAGLAVLTAGGTAIDAVTEAVKALEDDPLFNAGRGAVYTSDGTQEMDAAIMEGRDRRAGAVAGIFGPRHPILAAREVMERGEQVLLTGEGAARFCRDAGLEHCAPEWFATENRRASLEAELDRRRRGLPDDGDESRKHGTVGAVALDRDGNLAAATSTGGMTAKAPGRVGDSPVIGAGTWADNATCAISATGHGEFFIRHAVAHEISSRMRWAGHSLEEAADAVINRDLAPIGGSGGLIAVDARGNIALPFNCSGMYRGFARVGEGMVHSAIYPGDDHLTPV